MAEPSFDLAAAHRWFGVELNNNTWDALASGSVTAESADALSGPGFQYTEEFTLHSGAQVRLLDTRQGWMQVALPGGEIKGWMPAHAVEAVGRGD